jgi:uncharacterized protein YwqG
MADDSQIPVGASKLGGSPDVPSGFVWPQWNGTPLTFIGQFRLSEVAPFDVERILPTMGLLSFFYEADQRIWSQYSDKRGSWKVSYLENESAPLERVPHPRISDLLNNLAPCAVSFSQVLTSPVSDLRKNDQIGSRFYFAHSRGLEMLKILNADYKQYRELWRAVGKSYPVHQLLGNPDEIQDDIRYDGVALGSFTPGDPCVPLVMHDVNEWRLLLQIDSDDDGDGLGIMWGDAGCVYYCIQNDALDNRDFENCWLTLQSH